jgi:hypothetical protein
MHLQQTKRKSRGSGGPQYYFHDLTDPVKIYLRKKGAVRVALATPYGATKSDYFAVSTSHKLDSHQKPVPGKVGHDRIQQGRASQSIGEAIRHWYKLPAGDFERIDVDIDIQDDFFYITPLICKYVGKKRSVPISRIHRPLTIIRGYVSPLWAEQLATVDEHKPGIVSWALNEVCRVVKDNRKETKLLHIQETDILRASGPLCHLGMQLGGYVGRGYDCATEFKFLDYPVYSIPVEVKRNSKGFEYQQRKYGRDALTRAIVLCAIHDHKHIPPHIDVIELDALCHYLNQVEFRSW